VRRALDTVRAGAAGTDNLMPPLLEAARTGATVGEMCDALRDVWGEYVEDPIL
jgi:methylmalonyl-CoA mutase N-terminal domain/subunit